MKTLTCDICKRTIQNPVVERNYYHIVHRDICEPCKDIVEARLKPVVRAKSPFDYSWYQKALMDSIEKAIQRGKA